MPNDQESIEREIARRWVETWRRAGQELDEIRRREIESVDTREAVRQIFGSGMACDDLPPRTTSGLVEHQSWFRQATTMTPLFEAALALQMVVGPGDTVERQRNKPAGRTTQSN